MAEHRADKSWSLMVFRTLVAFVYVEASLLAASLLLLRPFAWPVHVFALGILAILLFVQIHYWSPRVAIPTILGLGWVIVLAYELVGGSIGWWCWALGLPVFAGLTQRWFWSVGVALVIDLSSLFVSLILGVGHSTLFLPIQDLPLAPSWLIFLWVQGSLIGLAFWSRVRVTSLEAQSLHSVAAEKLSLLETLIDLIPIPIFYKDKAGRFISGNVSFSVVLDIQKETLLGKTNATALSPANAGVFDEVELEVLSRESMAAEEVTLIHADGSPHSFIIYLLRFQAPQSVDTGFLGVLIDITSRKEREETLENLNSTKDRLFSIISHDLRGPVGKIQQLLDIWIDDRTLFDEPTWVTVFDDMRLSTHSLLHLLENLLSWARTQKGDYVPRLETFPIDPMIAEVFQLFRLIAQQKGVNLKTEIDLTTQIQSDKIMLSTILRNLVHNAVKFTRSGGVVSVRVHEEIEGIEIEVRDTGAGISPENLDKIMAHQQPFTTLGTAKEHGQGLGLSVCFDLAKALNAPLEVSSKVGQGSVFRLMLPVPELVSLADENPLDEEDSSR